MHPGASVSGIVPGEPVSVVAATWFGGTAVELTFKQESTGRTDSRLLYRSDEPGLRLLEAGRHGGHAFRQLAPVVIFLVLSQGQRQRVGRRSAHTTGLGRVQPARHGCQTLGQRQSGGRVLLGFQCQHQFAGARRLQKRRRLIALIGHVGIGEVMADHDLIAPREVDGSLEKIEARDGARRIVRIVQPQHLGAAGDIRRNRLEVR